MNINGKNFGTFIGKEELENIVGRLAERISKDYSVDTDAGGSSALPVGRSLVICPVLTGAFIFAADLVRRLTIPCEIRMVRYVSYSGMKSTGNVRCELPFPEEIEGRDVLIVEDVVDSGLSMQKMLEEVWALKPASVRVCTLLMKPKAFKGNYSVDYVGKEIGNEFIVGYGMDYDERGRWLPEVMKVELS